MKKHWRTLAVLAVGLIIVISPIAWHGLESVAHWLPTTNKCALGFSAGPCNYNPQNSSANFSLGEAVAALGLILTVLQLLDPVKRLALRLNRRLSIAGIVLLGVGFVSILISSLVGHLPVNYKIISFPIFWEVIGYFCFISAPLLYYRASTKISGLFRPKLKSAQNFYYTLLNALAVGQPAYIEAVARIFTANADEVIKAAKVLAPYTSRFRHESQEMPDDLEYAKYANDLIEVVLSEQKVANFFATQRVDYLFDILGLIKKHSLTSQSVINGTEKVFEQLYEDPNSHLYNQLEDGGLTLYAPLYEFLFGDKELFFIQELHILSAWARYGVEDDIKFSERYVEVHLKALNMAIETYGFRYSQPVQGLWQALSKLTSDYARSIAWLEDKSEKGKISTNRKILMSLERFLGTDFTRAYKQAVDNGTVSTYELAADSTDKWHASLTATYAEAVAEYFQIFDWQDKDDEDIRHEAMSATQELLSIIDSGDVYTNIRTAFFNFIWEKIKDNVENGHYPVVIRYYIQEFNWEDAGQPQWRKDERNKLYAYMKSELAPRLLKDEHMVNGSLKEEKLLPDNITFNKKSSRFYRTDDKKPIRWNIK